MTGLPGAGPIGSRSMERRRSGRSPVALDAGHVFTDGTLICETGVSHSMSTDTEDGDDRMDKIDVRVPAPLLEAIEDEYSRRGYSSRSAAIRDALRDWVNPSTRLSESAIEDLAESRDLREHGETVSAAEARDRLGLDEE